LHDTVARETGQNITLARPPHYVDAMPDGRTAYDLYNLMGYNYLAASVDGGGWMGCKQEKYAAEVDAMAARLRTILKDDPDGLNGKIIFQKDGYNMSRLSPVADALPKQLALLKEYGYTVVTVSELLKLSPVIDMSPGDPDFAAVATLIGKGVCLTYQNNTIKLDAVPSRGEFYTMLTPPEVLRDYFTSRLTGAAPLCASNMRSERELLVTPCRALSAGLLYAKEKGWDIFRWRKPVDKAIVGQIGQVDSGENGYTKRALLGLISETQI